HPSTLFPYTTLFRSTRDQQDNLKRSQDEAMSRVAQLREEALRIKDHMDEAGSQIARYEVALANLAKVQELAPRAEQDVQALNARSEEHTSELQSLAY